jgi:hypothetical protein
MTDRQSYIRTVLNLYAQVSDTACPPRRSDRLLAGNFFDRRIPIGIVEAALLLGSARRIGRRGALPLEAIRSLHYFQSIVEELVAQPPPMGYIDYLRLKVKSPARPDSVSPDQRA